MRTDPSGHSIDNGPDKDILPQHVKTAETAARGALKSLNEKIAEMKANRENLWKNTEMDPKVELNRRLHVRVVIRIGTRLKFRIDELAKLAPERAAAIEAEAASLSHSTRELPTPCPRRQNLCWIWTYRRRDPSRRQVQGPSPGEEVVAWGAASAGDVC